MRKFFEFIISTKTLLIAIYLFLAQYLLLGRLGLINSYRFSEQKYIYDLLLNLRRIGVFDKTISISWYIQEHEIHIYSISIYCFDRSVAFERLSSVLRA